MICLFCKEDFYAEIETDVQEHVCSCPLYPQHNKQDRALLLNFMRVNQLFY